MRKDSLSFRNPGTYTSPGTPDSRDNNLGEFQRGWCSERVALPLNSSKRHISAAASIPFSSGRALPSKWADAERWITSPLSGTSASRTPVAHPQRRPKSKSGPLDAQGFAFSPQYSPAHIQVFEGNNGTRFMAGSPLNTGSFMTGSPLTTGVLVPDGLSIHYGCGFNVQVDTVRSEKTMARSSNAAIQTDSLSDSLSPSSLDEKHGGSKGSENLVRRAVSRRDMATQMSSVGSPKERLSFIPSTPDLSTLNMNSNYSSKEEVRDVQVDKGATVTRQSRRDGMKTTKKGLPEAKELASRWDISGAAKNMSRLQTEEARISAWENLHKGKAEAAINKLEMKLEKKRSASMDRILNKLRNAQTKAHDMRELISNNLVSQAPRFRRNKLASLRRHVKKGSLASCFTSNAN